MKGFTAYICIGKYGGFRCVWDNGIRITIGWIGFAFVLFDIEIVMHVVTERCKELEKAAKGETP